MLMVALPIITVVGVVGNTLTMVIMNRPSLRSSSVSVYVSALAMVDSLVLIMDFLNNWLEDVVGVRFIELHVVGCSIYR